MRARFCVLLSVIIFISCICTGCRINWDQAGQAAASLAAKSMVEGFDLEDGKSSLNDAYYQNYRLQMGLNDDNEQEIKEALARGAIPGQFYASNFLLSLHFPPTVMGFALNVFNSGRNIKTLVEYGEDINYVDLAGCTYLIDCATNYHPLSLLGAGSPEERIKVLLQYEADPNIVSKEGFTALDYLIKNPFVEHIDEDTINDFLQHGAKVSAQTAGLVYQNYKKMDVITLHTLIQAARKAGDTGLTPLTEAAMLGDNARLISEMREGIPEEDEPLVLECTAAFGSREAWVALTKLIDYKEVAFQLPDDLLRTAAQNGNLYTVQYLTEHGGDVNNGCLLQAVRHDHISVARYLLQKGATVKGGSVYLENMAETEDVLTSAAMTGDVDLMELLLQYRVPTEGWRLRFAAAGAVYANQMDMLKFLISRYPGCMEPESKDDTCYPLNAATFFGNMDALKYLLGQGAAVNGFNNDGRPLLSACEQGQVDAVKMLLQNGASTNLNLLAGNGEKAYLLSEAVDRGDMDMLKALVEGGVKINDAPGGTSWVYFAAGNGSRDVLQYLIDHGGDINAAYMPGDAYAYVQGDTALHRASREGSRECAQALLAAGADITVRNSEGKTAYEVAADLNNQGMMQVFAKAGKAPDGQSTQPKSVVDKAVDDALNKVNEYTK